MSEVPGNRFCYLASAGILDADEGNAVSSAGFRHDSIAQKEFLWALAFFLFETSSVSQ